MQRIMIFEPEISGHVLEWLHHIHEYAVLQKAFFIFLLPPNFIEVKNKLNWKESSNVQFVFFEERELETISGKNLLKNAFYISVLARKYVKQYVIDEIFFIFLTRCMPFLPFLLPSKVKASGVLYRIYLYDSSKTKLRILFEKFRYHILARSRKIKAVFILNDEKGMDKLNAIYNTRKFTYLPDPIPLLSGPFKNLRKELNIPDVNKVYLQFGSIDDRKNSINILKAIELMDDFECKHKTFIFSGKINPSIRDNFFTLVKKLNSKVEIIVEEGFLSYERLNDLCFTSDYILTIYSNVMQSSGTIGYGAFLKKTVIGPSFGLLGNLIKDNSLGIVLDDLNPNSIKEALLSDFVCNGAKNYCESHTIDAFCKSIFKNILP